MFGYFEIEYLHQPFTSNNAAVIINVILFVKIQQNTSTLTQSVINYYFNISILCMDKVGKFAMKFSFLILRKIVKYVATRDQILRQNAPNSISMHSV